MYYNGNNRMKVTSFMNMVHQSIVNKYSFKANIDDVNAQLLQNFFQELKSVAAVYNSNDPIGNETIRIILENIQSYGISRNSNYNINNLFQRRGGTVFEKELTDVIHAVYESMSADELFEFDEKQVNIGGQLGTSIDFTEKTLSDKNIQKMLKKIGTKSQRYITTLEGKKMLAYYLPEIDGKIDVKGYEIDIKSNPTPEMLQIYNLLKDATFTAKNYDSMTWDQELKEFVQQTGHTTLSLGSSNIYRSIVGVLLDLGYDDKTAQSAFFAGLNMIDKGDISVASHFYHIRYLYELMGTGIKYNGQSYGEAKYLIYNDPHGSIYVKSTAKIFSEIIDKMLNSPGQAFMRISISKSNFN